MKTIKTLKSKLLTLISLAVLLSGCSMFGLDLQENYDYKKSVLPDHINMTAWDYLKLRADGSPQNPGDTIFRWMKKAIHYSGIDTNEYKKEGRTFIFLHNEAIRKWDTKTNKVTGGFFLDFPIMGKDPLGNWVPLTTTKWEQYDKETVKKYLLYLIAEGDYNYNNLTPAKITLQTLLPPNSSASPESRLGYLVTPLAVPGTTNGKDVTAPTFTLDYVNGGKGFDPEGKLTLQIGNTADSKLYLNGYNVVRSSGYYATNGSIHVWGTTIIPSR